MPVGMSALLRQKAKKRKQYGFRPIGKPIKKAIKSAIARSKELKFYSNVGSETTYQSFGAMNTWEGLGNDSTISMIPLAQGDADVGRDGDKVKVEYIRATYNICVPSVAVTTATTAQVNNNVIVRILLIQAKRGFTSTDVITALNSLTFGTDTIIKQHKYMDDICYILKDKTVVVGADTATYIATTDTIRKAQNYMVHFNVKPKNQIAEWLPASTTGVAPDVRGTIFSVFYYAETDPSANLDSPAPRYKMAWDVKFREL